jgi:response regulator NasT
MAYLVKPFQKKDLLPAIEMAMSRHAEIVGLEAEVSDLSGRLEARKLIDRAKSLLQSEHGLSEPDAFRWIQQTSMNNRTTMAAVAERVLAGHLRPAS